MGNGIFGQESFKKVEGWENIISFDREKEFLSCASERESETKWIKGETLEMNGVTGDLIEGRVWFHDEGVVVLFLE